MASPFFKYISGPTGYETDGNETVFLKEKNSKAVGFVFHGPSKNVPLLQQQFLYICIWDIKLCVPNRTIPVTIDVNDKTPMDFNDAGSAHVCFTPQGVILSFKLVFTYASPLTSVRIILIYIG